MTGADPVSELFAAWVERLVVDGVRLAPEELCRDALDLTEPLSQCIAQYDRLNRVLGPLSPSAETAGADPEQPMPLFEGFRTIERLGAGGGGEVYKLEDLELGRTVAAKVLRPDNPLRATAADLLREARCMALFEDPRIVRILDIRSQADPPYLLMEYVDGFALDKIGPSLEYAQRARVLAEVAGAIEHAHALGIQHRDLKPANILVDASLAPKILDFGLSRGERERGHGVGTLAYMAPELLDSSRPIDARTDVYALGVILYELLCGVRPYRGDSDDELMTAIRAGEPQLPVEQEPRTPEPLQAIALKAMERDPEQRYASAREMAAELRSYIGGRPVLARPSHYHSALGRRLRPHLEQVREWLRLKLIYPHEAEDLADAYDRLQARDDDWIVRSRVLSSSMITLYLGAFLLVFGGLLYFTAYNLEAVQGLLRPILVLGLPFAGLHLLARTLFRRDRKAVAVAFFLAAAVMLPLLLLVVLSEASLWPPVPDDANELFGSSWVSNRQLQVAALAACAWSCWLALSTHTSALASTFTALLATFHITVLAELGLRTWLEDGRWDTVAAHLLPLLVAMAVLGRVLEVRDRTAFARPLYFAAAGLYVLALELMALNGRAFAHLGLSTTALQGPEVSDPTLLDTLTTMTLNGVLVYGAAWALDRYGSAVLKGPSRLLYTLSPFAILEPIAYLSHVGEYSRRFDWLYLGLALSIALLSHLRQRKSFYYAGLVNTGAALWMITDHYEWWDRPAWAVVVVSAGLATLALGYGFDSRERRRRQT